MTDRFAWLRKEIQEGLTLPDRWPEGEEREERPVYETTADYVAAQHLALLDASSNNNLTEKRGRR
jgi:hypothetical protein